MERYRFPEEEQLHIENSLMPFAIYQFLDKRVVTVALSLGFLKLFGYEDKEKAYYDMDNDMYKDTHIDDAARIAHAAVRFATEGGRYDVIYRSKNPYGEGYNMIHAQGEHILTENGERLAQVWYVKEGVYSGTGNASELILDRSIKQAIDDSTFIKASCYDYLTGLPSMTYFFELTVTTRKSMMEAGSQPALMFSDFGGMKYFNRKYGFAEGDRLLQAFSRIIAEVYGNENCCRVGQDHFVMITKSDAVEESLKTVFEKAAKMNGGNSLPVHVGVYANWNEGVSPGMACDMAKLSCKSLKGRFASDISYYDIKMRDEEEKEHHILSNIDRAIKEKWITVYYQPIVRAVNGMVCDEEALARWIDPERGFMSPADFIPILEEHNLIYKLDLFVVECVLEKLQIQKSTGLHLVPQSVNLSRSDFDSCDIVEEIRKRVDDAGIGRSYINIEITESMIGRDFEFIKAQIERFRALGFAVWMDDFGSGYSSLEFLQDVKIDLIKFDMRFMQQFHEGNRGRIILNEMLKMATLLGIDTICEGVETNEQAVFLQETGCTKLQGFYFCKPIPVEAILERYQKGIQIGFENPEELDYFEAIGRVNLLDLSVIARENTDDFDNVFDALPMAVIEVNNGLVRFARSNQPYREFMFRYFGVKVSDKPEPFFNRSDAMASPFMQSLLKTEYSTDPIYVDEYLPNGVSVHSCMRRIAVNKVSGTYATAVAVLSVTKKEQ